MPRRIEPRWGEDGVQIVPDAPLTEEQLGALVERLGIDDAEDRERAKARLTEAAARFLTWEAQDENGPPRAWRTRALEQLETAAGNLLEVLAQLDPSAEARLLAALPVDDGKHAGQKWPPNEGAFAQLQRLKSYADRLRRAATSCIKHQGATAASQAVETASERFVSIFAGLDHATENQLLDALPVIRSELVEGGDAPIEDLRRRLDILRQTANAQAQMNKATRGPERKTTLPYVIEDLVDLYEKATGKPFTHSPYVKTKRTSEPQSEAGRFVADFFRMLERKPSFITTANTELDRLRRRRRAAEN